MSTIQFANYRNLVAFHSMCEGVMEVRADEGDVSGADALARLIEATETDPRVGGWPAVFTISSADADVARDIVADCLVAANESVGDMERAELSEDEEDCILPGEVVITP